MHMNNPRRPGRKEKYQSALTMSTLKRREIQSPIIACLIRELIREIGHDRAMEIASAAIQRDAIDAGKIMAEKFGGNSMKELIRFIKEGGAEENALEFTILEETNLILRFDVTRCRYAEMYDRLGIKELGYCLSCNRDAPLINSFNPRMKLSRTQTIMQGATKCDFRIIIE